MAVWSIKIVPGANPGDPARFVPQNQAPAADGTYPNGLSADPGDLVSWDNATQDDHLILQTKTAAGGSVPMPLGGLLWDRVTPGHQTAAWLVTGASGTTVFYSCLIHPQEKGKITVT
jgi:plastocyanin